MALVAVAMTKIMSNAHPPPNAQRLIYSILVHSVDLALELDGKAEW